MDDRNFSIIKTEHEAEKLIKNMKPETLSEKENKKKLEKLLKDIKTTTIQVMRDKKGYPTETDSIGFAKIYKLVTGKILLLNKRA